MRVLSADWVLPVEGEPIEHGAVAIEHGEIAAVPTNEDKHFIGAGLFRRHASNLDGFSFRSGEEILEAVHLAGKGKRIFSAR